MKYAILGSRKGVIRVSDTKSKNALPSGWSVEQITEEQATQIESARPRLLVLVNGELVATAEKSE